MTLGKRLTSLSLGFFPCEVGGDKNVCLTGLLCKSNEVIVQHSTCAEAKAQSFVAVIALGIRSNLHFFLGLGLQCFLMEHTLRVCALPWTAQLLARVSAFLPSHRGTLYQQQQARPLGQLSLFQPLVLSNWWGEMGGLYHGGIQGSQDLEGHIGGRELASWTLLVGPMASSPRPQCPVQGQKHRGASSEFLSRAIPSLLGCRWMTVLFGH